MLNLASLIRQLLLLLFLSLHFIIHRIFIFAKVNLNATFLLILHVNVLRFHFHCLLLLLYHLLYKVKPKEIRG